MRNYPQFTLDYVLHDLSLQNLKMLNAVIPSYNSKKSDKKEEVINADDPKNQERIKKALFG